MGSTSILCSVAATVHDHCNLWTVLMAICVALLSRTIYLLHFHPLSGYPGPRLWAISRIPWAYHVVRGDLWHALDTLHDTYGPVVRIAKDELTYIAPEAWSQIYACKPELAKDPQSQTPPLNGADSLFTAAGDDHRRIRAAYAHAFSAKAIAEQSRTVEHYAHLLLERIDVERQAQAGGVIDIQRLIGYACFDIISGLTWGESEQALLTPGHHTWNQRFFLHAKFSTLRNCLSRFPPVDSVLEAVLLRGTAKQREANNKLTWARLERQFASEAPRADITGRVIHRLREESHGKGISKPELMTNGVAIVIANSQLSTIAITSTIYFLLCNIECYDEVVSEISAARFGTEAAITGEAIKPLLYLKAAINESLRLHHPTPGSLPRIVGHGGHWVAGRFVPPGTVVGISLHNIHTRHENFHRPLEFHPERFLAEEDPRYDASFRNDRLDAFCPFSLGTRNCIGGRLFLEEATILLTRLLWKFQLEIVQERATNWLDQKAWLVYEPRSLMVKTSMRDLPPIRE